jgi:hypothetical protein
MSEKTIDEMNELNNLRLLMPTRNPTRIVSTSSVDKAKAVKEVNEAPEPNKVVDDVNVGCLVFNKSSVSGLL